MARFDSAIATTLRLIKRNGMQCAWTKESLTPIDTDRPWLGDTSVSTIHNPYICFVSVSGANYGLIKLLGGTESPEVKTWGLMGVQSFEPKITDLVTRSGQPLKMAFIDTLQPNEQIVLYTIGLVG